MPNVTATFLFGDTLARIHEWFCVITNIVLPTKRPCIRPSSCQVIRPGSWQAFAINLKVEISWCVARWSHLLRPFTYSSSVSDRALFVLLLKRQKQTLIHFWLLLRQARKKNKCPHLCFDRATSWAKILNLYHQKILSFGVQSGLRISNDYPSNRLPFQQKIRLGGYKPNAALYTLYVVRVKRLLITDVPSIVRAILLSRRSFF